MAAQDKQNIIHSQYDSQPRPYCDIIYTSYLCGFQTKRGSVHISSQPAGHPGSRKGLMTDAAVSLDPDMT
jgi:hypothetical protein